VFKDSYSNEIQTIRGILNSKVVVQNTYYKLFNDANLHRYFRLALKYAKHGGSERELGFNDHYFLRKESRNVMQVLNLFLQLMLSQYIEETSNDLEKPRKVFPDSGGQTVLKLLGFMPLLELVYQHINYQETIKNYMSDSDTDKMNELQEDCTLREESLFFKGKFLRDQDFINYELRNRHAEVRKQDFQEKEADLLSQMKLLSDHLSDSEGLFGNSMVQGKIYWDSVCKERLESDKQFTESLTQSLMALVKK
jgi:hypothetical protein